MNYKNFKSNKIKLNINEDNISIVIEINYDRKVYLDKKNYIVIIEIKPNDNLDINSFLEIDDEPFEKENFDKSKGKYKYKDAYFLDKNFNFINDKINMYNSNEKEIFFIYKDINAYGPIINVFNHKIIGIKNRKNDNLMNIETLIDKLKEVNFINKNNLDEVTIIYDLNYRYRITDKLNLFGKEFTENNKNLCSIIIDGKEQELCQYYDLKDINDISTTEIFKIKLRGITKIRNASYMFSKCHRLINLPDISKWDTQNVYDMSHMFEECNCLENINEIFIWNTKNVINMQNMFYNCSSLIMFPINYNWDISNVINISFMFYNCNRIKTMIDISKWNTSKITDMSGLFYDCFSLSNIPDVSKWNIEKVKNISYLFKGCRSIKSLPDISKWNTLNIINMNNIFENCTSLSSLPDISKWNTCNVKDISYMFSGCRTNSIPDISKWNTQNLNNISNLFSECKLLCYLPDISKWNTDKVIFMNNIFKGCSNLLVLKKWNIFFINALH